jgi:hypothetical protein
LIYSTHNGDDVPQNWLLKTDSLHRGVVGNSKMIIKTDINGRTETDSGGAEEVRAL